MKRRSLRLALYILVPVLLVGALFFWNSLRRSAHIVLPDPAEEVTEGGGASLSGDALQKVELTPDNVQNAIATLERPTTYSRTVTMELYWSGGSATTTAEVKVSGGRTRVDAQQPSGQVRHSITDGTYTWVWYDASTAWAVFPAGDISADDEEHIPTYEDILNLPWDAIAEAEYTTLSNVPAIYVETVPDKTGYVQCYWVSAETGLLIGAQRLADGELVYRVEALTLGETPAAADFILPDGTPLPPVKGIGPAA